MVALQALGELSLIGRNRLFLCEQEPDFIEALQHTVTGEGIDGKARAGLIGKCDRASFEIDGDGCPGMGGQPAVGFRVDDDGEQTVLERIAPERSAPTRKLRRFSGAGDLPCPLGYVRRPFAHRPQSPLPG